MTRLASTILTNSLVRFWQIDDRIQWSFFLRCVFTLNATHPTLCCKSPLLSKEERLKEGKRSMAEGAEMNSVFPLRLSSTWARQRNAPQTRTSLKFRIAGRGIKLNSWRRRIAGKECLQTTFSCPILIWGIKEATGLHSSHSIPK